MFAALNGKNANVVELQYRRDASGLSQLRVGAARKGSTSWSAWTTPSSGRHTLEVGWQSTSSATVSLWIDGQVAGQLTGLDTRAFSIETVRLGPSSGLVKAASGELQFDRFVSTRGSTIGP